MTAMSIDDEADEVLTSERALRWIGDLDHPFYDDERNRFVWYEASAIGFQMFILANMAIIGLMLWIAGATGLPYAIAVLVVNGIVAITVLQYAERRYADYSPTKSDIMRPRGLLAVAVSFLMWSGFVRAVLDIEESPSAALGDDSFSNGFTEGAVWGLASLPLILIAVALYKRHKGSAVGADEDLDEF